MSKVLGTIYKILPFAVFVGSIALHERLQNLHVYPSEDIVFWFSVLGLSAREEDVDQSPRKRLEQNLTTQASDQLMSSPHLPLPKISSVQNEDDSYREDIRTFDDQCGQFNMVDLLLKNTETELETLKTDINQYIGLNELNTEIDEQEIENLDENIYKLQNNEKTEQKLTSKLKETKLIPKKESKKPYGSTKQKCRKQSNANYEIDDNNIPDKNKSLKREQKSSKESPRKSSVVVNTKPITVEEKKPSKRFKDKFALQSIVEEKEPGEIIPENYSCDLKISPKLQEDKIVQTSFDASSYNETVKSSTPQRSKEFLPNTPNISVDLFDDISETLEIKKPESKENLNIKNDAEDDDYRYHERSDVLEIIKQSCDNKLSFQTLPALEIRRPLVTQKLPEIIIESNQNEEDQLNDKNVKYMELVYDDFIKPKEIQVVEEDHLVEEKQLENVEEELEKIPLDTSEEKQLSINEELNINVEDVPSVKTLKEIQFHLEQRCSLIKKRLEEEQKTPGEYISFRWRLRQPPKWQATSKLAKKGSETANKQKEEYSDNTSGNVSCLSENKDDHSSSKDTLDNYVPCNYLCDKDIKSSMTNSTSIPKVNQNKHQKTSNILDSFCPSKQIPFEIAPDQTYIDPHRTEKNKKVNNENRQPGMDKNARREQKTMKNVNKKTKIDDSKKQYLKQESKVQHKQENKEKPTKEIKKDSEDITPEQNSINDSSRSSSLPVYRNSEEKNKENGEKQKERGKKILRKQRTIKVDLDSSDTEYSAKEIKIQPKQMNPETLKTHSKLGPLVNEITVSSLKRNNEKEQLLNVTLPAKDVQKGTPKQLSPQKSLKEPTNVLKSIETNIKKETSTKPNLDMTTTERTSRDSSSEKISKIYENKESKQSTDTLRQSNLQKTSNLFKSVGVETSPRRAQITNSKDQYISCNLGDLTNNLNAPVTLNTGFVESKDCYTQYSPIPTVSMDVNTSPIISEAQATSPTCKDSSSSAKSSKFLNKLKHKRSQAKFSTPVSSSCSSTTDNASAGSNDTVLSEGEVQLPCECSTSIGEIHLCHLANNIRKRVKVLKQNPNLVMRQHYDSNMFNIAHQYKHYDNWVSYYVSKPECTSSGEIGTDSNLSSI